HEAFFACETIQQQVQELQNILRNRSERPGAILLQFLSTVYLAAYSPQSAALRRISFGALRELSSADVSPALHSRLGILMERSAVAEDADPCAHLDELSLLAAWHPHGVEALCADLPRVLAYLAAALRHVKPLSQLSSQERERASNYSSKVARCVAVLSKTNPGTETNKLILRDIHSNIWQLLIDESTTLSCRLSCGVSLPELSRAVDSPRGSGCGARTMLTAHHYELAAVPLAYVCFLSGMINITRLDDDEELQVFEDLLIDLDQLSSRQELQQEAPFALTCVRTVLQWTEKLAEDDQRSTRRLFERRLEDLLRIASMNIEHFVDAVQHQGKALFKTIITYLVKHFGQKYINFLQRTFKQLLGEAHYKKAKYAPLQTIAKHIEIQSMVDAAVVTEVYQALREKSMFPYVEDFLRDVGGKYRAENPAGFTEVWVRPFFAVFESGQCAPTVEGLLPVLLRLQPGLADEILSRSIDQRTYLLLALKALSPGQLFERPEILQHAQWTTDESVQHSLLRLLTECPKSCEPISPRLMPHVVLFLELNISTQSQALKQAMFSSFKKLLQRVADSDVYWRKPGKTHEIYGEKGMEDVLRQQRELVTSMWDFCLSQLHPGCSFFTRSTALMLLELLVPLANAKRWTQANVNTLLYWMKDTYESNKTAVTNILAKAPRQLLPFAQSEEAFDEWLKRSISLTRSARPPDGVTAAYILRLLAKIGQVQMRHETSESPRDTGGGTSFLPNGRFAQLFGAILPELRTQVEVALNRGLLEASSAAPMYSVLLCVRMLLNEALAGSLGPEHAETYRSVLREVLDLAYKISTVASSLVTNQSPEGRMELDEHPELVEQFKAALNKGFGKRLENADAVKTSAVAAQMLLLCCWRSHREVSLCFGDISAHLNKITALKILPDDEFVKMGVYFMDG
ncbi:thyroid adenoma-associated protein-like, partial [Tropilaelaps mercedesae]